MRLTDIAATVGQFVDLDEGRGQIIGTAGWSPCYSRIRLDDGSITCRQTAHILPMLTNRRLTVPVATAEKSAVKKSPAKAQPAKRAAKKPAEKPSWKELPDAELAAYLLERQTIPDRSWEGRSGGKSRDKGESRRDFIVRVLGAPS